MQILLAISKDKADETGGNENDVSMEESADVTVEVAEHVLAQCSDKSSV
jgi:hypothetical protein